MIQLAYVGFKVVDENGFIVDSVTFEEGEEFEIQPNWISELVPNFYKPKWTGTEWVEGATQEEIEEFLRQSSNVPILEERLIALENAMLMALMK